MKPGKVRLIQREDLHPRAAEILESALTRPIEAVPDADPRTCGMVVAEGVEPFIIQRARILEFLEERGLVDGAKELLRAIDLSQEADPERAEMFPAFLFFGELLQIGFVPLRLLPANKGGIS